MDLLNVGSLRGQSVTPLPGSHFSITMHPALVVDEIRLGYLTRKRVGWTRRQLENRRQAFKGWSMCGSIFGAGWGA